VRNKLFIIYLLLFSLQLSASEIKMVKLKCESGAYPGQIKRWSYNQKDLFEFYPNGYKRVYDITTINKKYILAEEDAVRGLYYVSINFDDNDINIIVETPLVKYIDNTCIKLK
jgi:hypothetical protein